MKTKLFSYILITLILPFISHCASTGFLMAKPKVIMFKQPLPSKSVEEEIDVFHTSLPVREYIEIAKITCGDTDEDWNMKQVLKKSREIGADGIIIIGSKGSYAIGMPMGNMAYAVGEGYGITAIAIKYK